MAFVINGEVIQRVKKFRNVLILVNIKIRVMSKNFLLTVLFALTVVLASSCAAIGGIFKAGVGVGIFLVVVVVIIVLWLISKARK